MELHSVNNTKNTKSPLVKSIELLINKKVRVFDLASSRVVMGVLTHIYEDHIILDNQLIKPINNIVAICEDKANNESLKNRSELD